MLLAAFTNDGYWRAKWSMSRWNAQYPLSALSEAVVGGGRWAVDQQRAIYGVSDMQRSIVIVE
jgi:hypothetical protein